MTGFRGNLKLNSLNAQGELYPGGTMKKEYTLKVNYDDKDDRCEVEEGFNEEEVVFNVDGKDIICPDAMSKCILELDNNILGLA